MFQIVEAPQWLIDFAQNREQAPKPKIQSEKPSGAATHEGLRPLAALLGSLQSPVPWSEAEEARLRSALKFIPATDRDVWFKVGAALHDLAKGGPRSAQPARRLWDEWSQTCPEKYDPDAQERTWESFRREYEGQRVTIATVYLWARQNGWVEPPSVSATANDEAPRCQAKVGVNFAPYHRTDAGNGDIFLALFGDDVRFVEKWGCWLVWDGARWVEKSTLAMLPIARQCAQEVLKWAATLPSGDGGKEAWAKHALAAEKEGRLRSMLSLAGAHAIVEPSALDADPWLLGCPNGTLDLRAGGTQRDAARGFHHQANWRRFRRCSGMPQLDGAPSDNY